MLKFSLIKRITSVFKIFFQKFHLINGNVLDIYPCVWLLGEMPNKICDAFYNSCKMKYVLNPSANFNNKSMTITIKIDRRFWKQ